jgi:type IV secretory pathway component VirB8
VGLSGKIRSIEAWASVSPERERLLIVLICVALGILAVIAIGVVALILSPPAILR